MNQMLTYYVVKRTKEKDEQFAVIDAMSLGEAKAIFEVRYKVEKEAMTEGEAFYIFQVKEQLIFDEKQRLVLPKSAGTMCSIKKW
ncbi:hypothetical protein [Bacillus benzoevorans]|uniref:Uncharacterized protein n=1 Tax=Bacillus benzoevorans TaxID=1456 RepID=A0A7X0HW70_9BACI|nr:hypothetical protein [Bacillus benzoevorans]MBB6447047.1 hypothetical protein [Bacillus benzoevorans]